MLASTEFDQSYHDFQSYPRNLIQEDLDVGSAALYRDFITNGTPRLFVAEDKNTEVKIRDLRLRNGVVELQETRACTDSDIVHWIGDTTRNASLGALPAGQVATYRDPQCRIIYLTAANSRSALKVTSQSLKRICSFHQIMPVYTELLDSVFGKTEDERNPTYFAFRDRVFLDGGDPGHEMPALGRSGRHIQLTYILKSIACTTPPTQSVESRRWSVRPAAFYHHFDVGTGASLWLNTHGRTDLYSKLAEVANGHELVGRPGYSSVQASGRLALRLHLFNATWALQGWYHYIEWFEARIKNETHLAVFKSSSDDYTQTTYTGEQLGRIQILEEKLNQAIMVLEGNIKMLTSLRSFYTSLSRQPGFSPQVARSNDIMVFDKELEKITSAFEIALTRAKYQSQLASQRKTLVLQHLQDQNIAKTEALALNTRDITIDAQHEAVVMRIITVVTLIYLPATFVSTFFSTDVIKYQDGVQFSLEAMDRWLQVTLPLTLVTFLVAGWFFWGSWTQSRKMKGNVPKVVIKLGKG